MKAGFPKLLLRLGLLLAVFAGSSLAESQALDAQIEGTVTDTNGSVIPGSSITVINRTTGAHRKAAANENGIFRFPILPLGTYSLMAEYPGFKRFGQNGIELSAGQTASIAVRLELGTPQEAVTVTSDAAITDIAKFEVGRQINSRDVKALPLVSRNPLNFALLQPGVTGRMTAGPPVVGQSSNGLSRRAAVGLDGGYNNDADRAGFRLNLISEVFVKEVQLLSSGYSAEFGNTAGMIVNVVTPSGTNEFDGAVSAFWRPAELSSKPFGFTCGGPEPNIDGYGVTAAVGGPIIKDKWHFFGAFERTLWKTLPVISVSESNRNQLVALGLPESTFFDDEGVTDWFPFFIVRSDVRISDSTRLAFRYNRFRSDTRNVGAGGGLGQPTGINTTERSAERAGWDHAIAAEAVTSLSEEFFNEFRFQRTERISGTRANDRTGTGPTILITNVAAFGPGPGVGSNDFNQSHTQFQNAMTKVFATHLIKFGGGLNFIRDATLLTETSQYTFASVAAYRDAVTGENRRSYLNYDQTFGEISAPLRSQFINLFFQDDWNAAPGLKISAGLRYDLYTAPGANPDSPLPFSKTFHTDKLNFGPRIGIAYLLREGKYRTVIRAGGGLHYDPPILRLYRRATQNNGNPQFFTFRFAGGSPTGPEFPNTLGSFPPGTTVPRRNVDAVAPDFETMYAMHSNFQIEQVISEDTSLTAGFLYSRARHIPTYRNINCMPTGGTLADGRPLYGTAVVRPDGLVTVSPCTNRVYPDFNVVLMAESGGSLDYRAVFLQLHKRFGDGFQAGASYTWSKARDDAPEIFGSDFRMLSDPSNRETERSDAWGDVRNVFRLSGVARPHLSIGNRFISGLLNNNQIALIVFADSGEVDNIVTNLDLNRDGVSGTNGPDRPVGLPRNSLRLPAFFSLDMRLSRSLKLNEILALEIYGEATNLFNSKNVSSYGSTTLNASQVDAATGLLSGSLPDFSQGPITWRPSRQIQIGLRLRF